MFYVGLPQLTTGTKTTLTKGGGAVDKQERKISIKINGQSKDEKEEQAPEKTNLRGFFRNRHPKILMWKKIKWCLLKM